MAGLTALFSVDLILAQHYLPAEQAGLYGGLSTLGRIIYFATLPFTTLMFPTVTSRVAAGRSSRRVLLLTGGALVTLTLGVIVVYALAPGLVIQFTLGQSYLKGAAYLWWFAVFFGLVALATWFVHALLAHQQLGIVALPPLALVLQLLLIARFHGSLVEIMGSSVVAATVLVVGLSVSVLLRR
jgi:O-antigen/teichoic acid export membrane protein